MRIEQARLWWVFVIGCLLVSSCASRHSAPAPLVDSLKLERAGSPTWPPYLGLALAGGGTKASAFSIGVLKGLVDSGEIEQVDVISSVSGGSYAAYWFYSRLVFDAPNFTADGASTLDFERSLFLDCMPFRYMKHLSNDSDDSSVAHVFGLLSCPQPNNTNLLAIAPDDRFKDGKALATAKKNYTDHLLALGRPELGTDPYRVQNYLRGYQDLFSTGRNILGAHAFDYDTTVGDNRLPGEVVEMLPLEVGSIALNAIANIAFDWNVNVSSTQYAYAKGIARTYGASAPDCARDPHACIVSMYGTSLRLEGDIAQARSLNYEQLKEVYQHQGAPLWIINATASNGRGVLTFGKQEPVQLSAFEITPFGFGSDVYRYWPGQFEDLTPLRAVEASAAFLDSQQRVQTKPPIRNLINAAQKIGAVNWGLSVRNPNEANDAAFAIHHLLPFPLYYLDNLDTPRKSTYIHLSDGGMSENLGAYALVRRRVPNIIIADNAQDRAGSMGDLCRLKSELARQGLRLLMPGLGDFDRHCQSAEQDDEGYDIFAWDHPVLTGCIVTADFVEANCAQLPLLTEAGQYAAHLFVIKPALKRQTMQENIKRIVQEPAVDSTCLNENERSVKPQCMTVVQKACTASNSSDDSPMWRGAPAAPCELYGFVSENFTSPKGIAKDGRPYFPQFGTVALTGDSSPWIYGAMRELGAYYARRLAWFVTPEGKLDEARFQAELAYQQAHPMGLGPAF